MPDNKKEYTVWVGGVEVNDYYLTLERASELADEWREDGYDDVVIEWVPNPDHWDNSCQTLQTKFNTGWEWLENNDRV